MEAAEGDGLFFTKQELIVLYGRLQGSEDDLSSPGRAILKKVESFLYLHLSIEEMEKLHSPYRGAV
jgi:hypothetical protein